jgi:2,3-bisphosphoglycerate-dependent phosphoglycerate mutase
VTPAGPATLFLARHGQTVWHAENRYAGGVSDVDLTPAGVAQARALAAWARARRLDAVVASPVRRAQETAAPVAAVLGVPVETVDDLREVRFGVAEGRTLAEVAAEGPDGAAMVERFRADPVAHPFPGAEPPADAANRCARALRATAARARGATVLVVAHNTLLRLGLCALIGLPVSRYRHVFPRLDNAAVSEIRLSGDVAEPAALLSLNVPCSSYLEESS